MYNLSIKEKCCLENILQSIAKIETYLINISNANDFYNQQQVFDAVLMNFITIGEMVNKLSTSFIETTKGNIDWYGIRGFRNILAHDYFGIDAEEIWQVIKNDLPELKKQIEKILQQ